MKGKIVGLIVLLALGLLAAPRPGPAQEAGKVYRIGFLGITPLAIASPTREAFRQGLRDLGWMEGHNLHLEWRWTDGEDERFPALAAELVQLQVDAIVVVTTAGTRTVMQATQTIPIVFTAVADPVGSGLVASLARPGGNATGPSLMWAELASKLLELGKEAIPGLSRGAVLWEPGNPGAAQFLDQLQWAVQRLGVTLHAREVREAEDLAPAIAALTRERPDVLIVPASVFTYRAAARIATLARQHQLPTLANWEGFPWAGGLMSYGASFTAHFKQAAQYVDKILKGAQPAELPVEQPIKFELVLNLKTAQALGVTIPPTLLFQADEVLR
jgi:putative ABC transport system substrate-binding protein